VSESVGDPAAGATAASAERRPRLGWWASGAPWVWLTAGSVTLSILVVAGLLLLIAVRGMAHFWPAEVLRFEVRTVDGPVEIVGQRVGRSVVDRETYRELEGTFGLEAVPGEQETLERWLVKTGNRDNAPPDFRWLFVHLIATEVSRPEDVWVLERTEWGNAYGFLSAYETPDPELAALPPDRALRAGLDRVRSLRDAIEALEEGAIGAVNYRLEQLRLQQRGLELAAERLGEEEAARRSAALESEREALRREYADHEAELRERYRDLRRDTARFRIMGGREIELPMANLVRAWQPNGMGVAGKLAFYGTRVWAFLTEDPREANTEGGIFPAIFGTVMMVLLMSLLVTPFGVVAAVYLREYARQGFVIRLIRIAVNNLAGVPSIVYGVFGLGFFVYFLGGNIDALFFPEALPAPTFGTPGLLWASLTLAILTVPVVIVSTEEGLARIPRSVREGSLALGATKAETLWKIVLPMASPSIMTGVILAIARAAGEVAPLMLVGVVKLAPELPVDGNFPYVHLDRKFMHLGFHIYDVGFQSPNVEAARPLVYATALLLVVIIIALNLTAIMLRNRLRNRFRSVE
jgi:phosphate transport system permease protein